MRQPATTRGDATIRDTILASLDALTPAERRVGRAVLEGYPAFGLRSATAIAAGADASPATVLRFVTKLGFEGFPRFQAALRQEIDERLHSPFELAPRRVGPGGLLGSVLDDQQRILSETIGRLEPGTIALVARLIMDSSRVWTMGGRFSHAVAHYLCAHLQVLRPGVRLVGVGPGPVADELADCGRRDCLVVFDFRRYDGDAAFAARFVHERRGRVIVVTDPYLSPAAQSANHTLVTPVEGRDLADSYVGAVALADALVSQILISNERGMRTRIGRIEAARERLKRSRLETLERGLAPAASG